MLAAGVIGDPAGIAWQVRTNNNGVFPGQR
jgi:hypothetical protein